MNKCEKLQEILEIKLKLESINFMIEQDYMETDIIDYVRGTKEHIKSFLEELRYPPEGG